MTGNFKIYPLFGWAYPDWETPFNQEKFNDSKDMAKKVWDCIGKHLERNNQEYLVCDRVTLADIVVAGYFVKPLQYALDADFRKDYPKTEAYLRKLYETKEFKAVIGELKFIDKFEPPK
jgi:glutathione S-transferase